MKILILSMNYSPEQVGIGKYSGEMARWLAARGHELCVITAPPYYPWWQVQKPYRAWAFKTEQLDGVTVIRCPTWVPRRPNTSGRFFHLMSFALSSALALIFLLRRKPAWVFVLAPTLLASPAALLYARLVGARSWLHVQDFELGAAIGLGMAKNSFVWRFAKSFERFVIRGFTRLSSISETMCTLLCQISPSSGPVTLFPNWVDCEVIHPDVPVTTFRQQLEVRADDCLAVYAGTLNPKQNLELVIEAAYRLQDVSPQIKILICGVGPSASALKAKAEGLSNILWRSPYSAQDFPKLLAAANIHLLPQRPEITEFVMPSKLGSMLASGRPVVTTAAADSELAGVVKRRGIVVDPGDASGFANAIRQLAEDADLQRRLGRSARQYALSSLSRDQLLSGVEAQLKASL